MYRKTSPLQPLAREQPSAHRRPFLKAAAGGELNLARRNFYRRLKDCAGSAHFIPRLRSLSASALWHGRQYCDGTGDLPVSRLRPCLRRLRRSQ
jgi:hypothetical protein